MKIRERNGNATKLLFSLKGFEILYQERGQMKTIVMKHFNGKRENFFSRIWQGKKSMSWRNHDAIARASTRIGFQEPLIRFSKLGFPVAHGMFLNVQYKDYQY